jgi:hypothetical protein
MQQQQRVYGLRVRPLYPARKPQPFAACSSCNDNRGARETLPRREHKVVSSASHCIESCPWVTRVWRAVVKQTKASARLDLEVSAGWASPYSRGLWGGDALLLSVTGNRTD